MLLLRHHFHLLATLPLLLRLHLLLRELEAAVLAALPLLAHQLAATALLRQPVLQTELVAAAAAALRLLAPLELLEVAITEVVAAVVMEVAAMEAMEEMEVAMEALMEVVTQATVTAAAHLLTDLTITTQATAATLEGTEAAMEVEVAAMEVAAMETAAMDLEMDLETTEVVLQTLPPAPKVLAAELLPLPSSQSARWLSPRTLSHSLFMDRQL
jgi:hypothetical protein